jgi:hypothetical protein
VLVTHSVVAAVVAAVPVVIEPMCPAPHLEAGHLPNLRFLWPLVPFLLSWVRVVRFRLFKPVKMVSTPLLPQQYPSVVAVDSEPTLAEQVVTEALVVVVAISPEISAWAVAVLRVRALMVEMLQTLATVAVPAVAVRAVRDLITVVAVQLPVALACLLQLRVRLLRELLVARALLQVLLA